MAVPKFLLPFATAFALALVGAIRLTIAGPGDASGDAAQGNPSAPSATAKPDASTSNDVILADEQAKLSQKYKELERVVLRMAEVMQSSDPRRAALLRQAFAQSRERQIGTQFDDLVKLLQTDQLYQASKGQTAVDQDLNRLLLLLMSGDRDKQIPNDRAEIKRFIERINKLIREQQGIEGETEGQGDPADLANRQEKLANRTTELAKDLHKFDERNNPNANDSSNADGKDADGKNAEGKDGDAKDTDGKKSDGKKSDGKNSDGKKADGKNADGNDAKGDDQKSENGADSEKGDSEKGGDKKGDAKSQKSNSKQGAKNSKNGKSDSQKSDDQSSENAQGDADSEQKGGEKSDGKSGSQKSGAKKSDGKKSGGKGEKSDAKNGEKGDEKADDQSAEGKDGEKSGEKSDKGSKSGKKGSESKSGKAGQKSNQKDGGKDAKSEDGKSDAEKSDDQKSDDQKSAGERSDGQKSGSKSSKSGKSGQKSQKGSKDSKDGEQSDEQSDPQNGDQQQDDQSSDEPEGRKRIRQAEDRMRDAKRKLEEAERRGAAADQQKAIEELKQAKAALEEILRQLREEEVERVLAMLEGRFRKMLQLQVEVYEGTIALDRIPEEERDRNTEIESGKLSKKEANISAEAEKTLTLLREEGSSVAFPESVEQLREDMDQVTARLGRTNIGSITQGVEQDIVKSLEEMVAALQKAQKEQQKGGQQKGGKKGNGGQQQDQPLVNAIAELKMIRALQMRVNTRTERYSKLLADGTEQAEAPDLVEAVKRLSEREERIHKTTRDIVVGRNK
jgi:hypothetical protein